MQTAGVPMDSNLAAYYATPLSEHELHPAWSMHHQQLELPAPAAATEPAQEPAKEAGPAAAHQTPDAHGNQEPQSMPQGPIQAAPQQLPLPDMHPAVFGDTEPVMLQSAAKPVERLQQEVARARDRLAQTLSQGQVTADRFHESAAKLIMDRGLPWKSPHNWAPSPWDPPQTTPTWPPQPVTPVTHDSFSDTPAKPELMAAQSAAELVPLPQNTPEVSSQDSAVATEEAAEAETEAVAVSAAPRDSNHLLDSFRLHNVTEPCVLSTLQKPISNSLPSLHFTGDSAHALQSSIQVPRSELIADDALLEAAHQDGFWSDHEQPTPTAKSSQGDAQGVYAAQEHTAETSSDRQASSISKQPGGLPADQASASPKLAWGRAGSVGGRDDMVVEPKYTPGVPAPPRGTLQIAATAGTCVAVSTHCKTAAHCLP